MKNIKDRKNFCHLKIKKNIFEFGCLIITLMGNFNDQQVYNNSSYRKSCMELIKKKKNNTIYELLDFIFDKQMGA